VRFQAVASAETSCISSDIHLRTCFHVLETLNDIAVAVFCDESAKPTYYEQTSLGADLDLVGPLSTVSSWLRTYLARVTSVEPSKPLRRTIMVFLNLVPMDFLSVVQSMLDQMPGDQQQMSSDISDDDSLLSCPKCPKNQLALEIFAHWLVLVMLLDGVWWVGNTGDWELRRIIFSMRHKDGLLGRMKAGSPKLCLILSKTYFTILN